ncbi:hypothetical protein [Zunongwangia endophytica]|uniref:Uncharacterized protein n=1 Tax=Zunongwangia endophytica TaxID=1808945 RepID=A0ABV8HEF9_9FLAO|nr:hypothetical protein [Zunongwangia endophytica]MDN3594324.1 hypothetical protein [Zunongwangia endophytica]
MRKIYLFCVVLIILISITSCEYDCFGFPEEYDEYISFELNDTILYTNENDTLKFTVNDYNRTEPSSFTGLAMDYDCFEEKFYQTDVQDEYFIREYFEENYNSFQDGILISFTENDTFGLVGPTNFSSNNFEYSQIEYYQNFQFNGTDYNDVLFILKDTINSNPKIGYILKANPGGILEFYDFENKELWKQIN